ncbi:AraC family transcriptional regulator [uncultured Brevundimonas sp.]|uniref:AraC family transcriptional regulator n=1 Tax=uncultured Brevundimonas sp. TaxID=213418 RepID=UPI0025F55A5F|nr:AraC family transcriptional regulator [uncultured Brevundimonas sp.]
MTSRLTDAIARILDRQGIENGGFETPVPGLRLIRTYGCVPPRHMTYRPSLCLIAQAAKRVMVGDSTLTYGHMQSLVITVEVPVLSEIIEATPDKPFIGATLALDPDIILDVVTRMDKARPGGPAGLGLVVEQVDERIATAMIRLIELVDQPEAIEILYPGVMREIAYWLMTGRAAANVARMVLPEGPPQRIAVAIHHLRNHFDQPLSVGDLARLAGMSPSAFHQHFKALTSMSPLQYQKHLRLLDARRRMLTEGERAGSAAFSVGYESVSQFSREYARMFGDPPHRETKRARLSLTGSAAMAGAV